MKGDEQFLHPTQITKPMDGISAFELLLAIFGVPALVGVIGATAVCWSEILLAVGG